MLKIQTLESFNTPSVIDHNIWDQGVSGRETLGGQVLNRLGPPGCAKGRFALQKFPKIGLVAQDAGSWVRVAHHDLRPCVINITSKPVTRLKYLMRRV